MVIKHAVGSAHHRLTVSLRIPSDANSRLNIIRVSLNSLLQTEEVIPSLRQRCWRPERRRNLDVVPYSIIQRNRRSNPPRVLPERPNGNVVERVARAANSLDEILWQSCAIGLYRRQRCEIWQKPWSRIDESQARSADTAEVVHSAVVHRKHCVQWQVVEIRSELGLVASNRPRERVSKLIPLFRALNVRERLASKISEARNIYGWIRSTRNGSVVEVRQAAACILEEKLVYLVVPNCPGILRNARYVTEGLFRCTRISI